ncbi:hypothetical protein RV04_GL002120 [Enterococcus hermanniensis]|uniref:Uncharacterized protein n=1 Tax=Enterococcus hermanniensis TaxID=249189 RepID=A0A1L8TMT6_9ENTE|nr:hypothetical protein RV04_GL002120 [Enterococcus hermanniensis]
MQKLVFKNDPKIVGSSAHLFNERKSLVLSTIFGEMILTF